jgi:cyclopropane-fatty-acyl-phospholipid synthase
MRNTPDGSRRNISLHYDLGNEFFQLMLDSTMTYSCGIFESENTTLEEASLAKYDRILDQLEVSAGTHILEIGCGWGGFAIRAADKYGCKVTALTISQRQFEFAQKRVREAGLSDRVEIVLKDYRHIQGEYDRVVSIEMVEAVGHNYLPVYFSRISALLRDRSHDTSHHHAGLSLRRVPQAGGLHTKPGLPRELCALGLRTCRGSR